MTTRRVNPQVQAFFFFHHKYVQNKIMRIVDTPAGELLHCDSLLDEVLSFGVNQGQSWRVTCALVLEVRQTRDTFLKKIIMCENVLLMKVFLVFF